MIASGLLNRPDSGSPAGPGGADDQDREPSSSAPGEPGRRPGHDRRPAHRGPRRPGRLHPVAAFRATRGGAVLIDTRPGWQRRADGEIPGAIVIERNHLEWRRDPASPARVAEAADHQVAWIICCAEGYSSSLAAASLQALGLSNATDVIGGFRAWRAAGLPVTRPAKPARPRPAGPDP
jgi:rhodanese-related sulfurtransferase